VHDKNQLVSSTSSVASAEGTGASNEINFLGFLFDLEKTLNNSERNQPSGGRTGILHIDLKGLSYDSRSISPGFSV
jgi:hypothetical protein